MRVLWFLFFLLLFRLMRVIRIWPLISKQFFSFNRLFFTYPLYILRASLCVLDEQRQGNRFFFNQPHTHKKAAHKKRIKDVNSQCSDVLLIFCWRSNLFFLFQVGRHLSICSFIFHRLFLDKEQMLICTLASAYCPPTLQKKKNNKREDEKTHENRLSQSLVNMNDERRRCGRRVLLLSVAKRIYSNNNHNNTTS